MSHVAALDELDNAVAMLEVVRDATERDYHICYTLQLVQEKIAAAVKDLREKREAE